LIKILVFLVVIGAGTAGPVTAAGAAGPGAKAALIEGRFMGGDCLSVGSVPSKAIISAARASAPPIAGIDTVPYLTNENRFSLTELPSASASTARDPSAA
jgi:flavin-dependent dehydrogenase